MRELHPLLRQSYRHVRLYKKLLDERNVRPEEVRSYADIRKLPVTSKKLLRQSSPEEYINSSFPRWSYAWTETSGSTGEPFKFPLNKDFYFIKKYYCGTSTCPWYTSRKLLDADPSIYRFLVWRGWSFRTLADNVKFADIRTVDRPRGNHFLHIPVSDLREHPLLVVKKLREFQPDVLSGRATTMIELDRIIKKAGNQEDFRVSFITSVGEMLSETQRRYLENGFNCEVYERYGLEELGDVAVECRYHRGMHIYEESNIVEIVDENNRPLPPGSRGRVVVTNLCNYSVPFIRYDTGDIGEILPGRCPCGVSARRLKLYGRTGAYLELAGRRYQFPEFAAVVNNFNDIVLRSQIAKVSDESIEFRFVPLRPVSPQETDGIKSSFMKNFGITPRVKIVEDLPFNTSGKTQFLVDETSRI
ncbi:phenylacetate--CoA ligase family protein [Candidatus Kaiserbacteria bacterium]|nr:phenylacetate--CoA ligase family protein [Candidatus Kaiserbacteria bacterium]